MKKLNFHYLIVAILAPLFLTGCYTQLQSFHDHRTIDERDFATSPRERGSTTRDHQVDPEQISHESEEAYLQGYQTGVEHGWADAEAWYKDYELAEMYRRQDLSMRPRHHYSPTWSHFGVRHHIGWSWRAHSLYYADWWVYDPWYGWVDPFHSAWAYGGWAWHRYPHHAYSYGWYGNGYGYRYQNIYVRYYNNTAQSAPAREYTARSTGMRSGVATGQNRVRTGSAGDAVEAARTAAASRTGSSLEVRTRDIRSSVRQTGRSGAIDRSTSSSVSGTNSEPAVRSSAVSTPPPRTGRTGSSSVQRSTGSTTPAARSTGRSATRDSSAPAVSRSPASRRAPAVSSPPRGRSSSPSSVGRSPAKSSGSGSVDRPAQGSRSSGSTGRSTGRSRN
ncbi:MAG: hypothetical protein WD529_07820 [Balneolaceae bacterium]